MGALYLSSDLHILADRLAQVVDAEGRDIFNPTHIVVPNRYMRKWLRLHLARAQSVAINIKFEILEPALWTLFRETDPNTSSQPESLDVTTYQLMVLSVLLEDKDSNLASLERYLGRGTSAQSRQSCRRAWELADRFGQLIRDYEYARQDTLIQPWLQGWRFGLPNAGLFHRTMERAQRAIFTAITREPAGRRAILNLRSEKNYKTFPQYAMERMLAPEQPNKPGGTIHFFGFTEISLLHGRSIAWLSQCFDFHVYHWNVLANRMGAAIDADTLRDFVEPFRSPPSSENADPTLEMLHLWGRAGAESLELLAPIARSFQVERLTAPETPGATVLDRLRDHVLGRASANDRLPQDTSLQIVGCPGVPREVQTVYDSIVTNLQRDPTLRQTDIGVLATDMTKYRAALQAVFERGAANLHYSMVDFNAAGTSTFAQAVLGMFDLALETFARSRVFTVLLNPCFLARLEIDRSEAVIWLEWAEKLGIYHGWDATEKAQHGYAPSPRFSWKLGLQRLRLGRYMDCPDESRDGPAPRFGDVVPFADVESTDRQRLDGFCRAIEGLLPVLADLRKLRANGKRWADALRRLVNEFLDIPPDRPEESKARSELLSGVEKLAAWDFLRDVDSPASSLPLALVREFVQRQFKSLDANQGEYLVSGVTIAKLEAMRPMPFKIVYLLGLGEALFPGSNQLSSFDLRGAERLPGDIRPAEARVFDFLTTVASPGTKLYLLYNNHDLQRDQPLLPAATLLQLKRYLDQNILIDPFREVTAPFGPGDVRYLESDPPAYQDVLVQSNLADRTAAILEAERAGRLDLNADQVAEWSRHCRSLRRDFSVDVTPAEAPDRTATVPIGELRRFLQLPAAASLRRHLGVEDEYDNSLDEYEPLVTSWYFGHELIRQTLQQIVLASATAGVDVAVSDWQDRFAQVYADARACSRTPEAVFGEIDQASLTSQLQERIHGEGRIAAFLRERAGATFCGPVLLGESLTPLGARLRFPALKLQLGGGREARLVGSTALAWHSSTSFDVLILSPWDKIKADKIDLALIEPFLLYLALLANREANADGIASGEWLAPRQFAIHVAHPSGIVTWCYPAGDIDSNEAAEYLNHLVGDFLTPDSFDFLPLQLIAKTDELCQPYQEPENTEISAEDYYDTLCDKIEDEQENGFSSSARVPLFVDMIRAEIPADALAKVRRRFALLDRGPALVRSQPKNGKRRSAKK